MYSYFNECLPTDQRLEQYAAALMETSIAYASLKALHPSLGGIVSNKIISSLVLSDDGSSLEDCIRKVGRKDIRCLVFSWLVHSPIKAFFDEEINEEDLIDQSYTLSIAGTAYPATNLAIALNNDSFLFTLGVHHDLRLNELKLIGSGGKTLHVPNLFSKQTENVSFIEQFISEIENAARSITEQIDSLLNGKVARTNSYTQSFKKLGIADQQSILDRLKEAKSRGLLGFTVDQDIFKHTKGFDKKEKYYGPVYELRVREPKEIRVYFQYIEDMYYVLSMGFKGNNQNLDIELAFERISQLRVL